MGTFLELFFGEILEIWMRLLLGWLNIETFGFVVWVRSLVGVLSELATFGLVSPTGSLLNIASFLLCPVRLSQRRVVSYNCVQ